MLFGLDASDGAGPGGASADGNGRNFGHGGRGLEQHGKESLQHQFEKKARPKWSKEKDCIGGGTILEPFEGIKKISRKVALAFWWGGTIEVKSQGNTLPKAICEEGERRRPCVQQVSLKGMLNYQKEPKGGGGRKKGTRIQGRGVYVPKSRSRSRGPPVKTIYPR